MITKLSTKPIAILNIVIFCKTAFRMGELNAAIYITRRIQRNNNRINSPNAAKTKREQPYIAKNHNTR